MPDHLHCIWTLPDGDTNYSLRWSQIKHSVSLDGTGTYRSRQVKHGLVAAASEWPYSTFGRYVRNGVYPAEWGGDAACDGMELE